MSSDIGLRFPVWDLNLSKYEEIDSLPLMATPGPVLMILAVYLLFVLKIGPALMVKREPYKLTGGLIFYNALQVAISAYMAIRYFSHLWNVGMAPRACNIENDIKRSGIILSIWFYFIAKVSELFDTVFFVLRKKYNQVTFLHLYHHSIMMIGTWAYLKYWPSETLVFIGFMNSLVHVFMYTYYGLAAMGPSVAKYIFWKKYMTKFQLVQFVCIILHYIIAVNRTECPPSKGVATFIGTNTAFFLILFLHFYRQNYIQRKNKINANGDVKTKIEKEA